MMLRNILHLKLNQILDLFHSGLMKLVRTQGKICVSALPQESVIANMTRRVLKLIREEFETLQDVRFKWHISAE